MRTLFAIGIAVLLFVPAPAAAEYDITLLYHCPDGYRLAPDVCVAQVFDIIDVPNDPTKRHFRDDPGLYAATVGYRLGLRVAWRLEQGDFFRYDWSQVSHQLEQQFGVKIGMTMTCTVGGEICPVECYSFDADVYPRYSRDIYLIDDGQKYAVVSVMTPSNGCSLDYTRLELVDHTSTCNGSNGPSSTIIVCASTTVYPFVGYDCAAITDPNDKRKFRDEPALAEPPERTTWGAIKALYR